MNTITTNIAADINRHHRLACLRADEAINHALEAGKLLLEAKAAVTHGEWIGWLDANVSVTPRQAQRYMQVAQGKPLPIRAIPAKTTQVSHLKDWTPKPAFIPIAGHWCWCVDAAGLMAYVVEPSAAHPGFYFVSHLHDNGETYDCTRRPVRADWVDDNLKYFGLPDPAGADWHVRRSDGVRNALDTINAAEVA